MRVLMLSKACIVGQYQTKLTRLGAQPNLELTVVVPPSWRDERGELFLEKKHIQNYTMVVAPLRFNGHFHIHYYPTLSRILEKYQPDLLHIDEEPYNLATFHAAHAMRQMHPQTKIIFFSWQNIFRAYPPPFTWMEKFAYRNSVGAIAGNREAAAILQRKGLTKPIRVIPQFGVPESFAPQAVMRESECLIIGYAGRLVHEKGIQVLLRALASLQGEWQLRILGSGPVYGELQTLAREFGIQTRVQFTQWMSSSEMPNFYNSLDVLVVPSLTRPNWKEQFGRVLMEAMACGVPVIGSESGEIPHVVGDAGIIVPENDSDALTRSLNELMQNPTRRQQLARAGQRRARENFSEERVVRDTLAFYQEIVQEQNKSI